MFRRFRVLCSLLAAIAVVAGTCEAVAFVVAPRSGRAEASPVTGTAGMFVPLQGRLLDTRSGSQIGPYNTPMAANQFRSVQVEGASYGSMQIPTSGVSAIVVSATTIHEADRGILWGSPDGSTNRSTMMIFSKDAVMSNVAIIAVGDNGKISVGAQYSTDLVLDVQGYYTTGNGSTAAGGFVPVTPTTLANTATGEGGVPKAPVAPGKNITVKASGLAGIPSDASAVFVNVTAYYASGSGPGYLTAYPTGTAAPYGGVTFPGGADPYAMGLQTALGDGNGSFNITIGGTDTVNFTVSVTGYFAAGAATGAFTPAATRVYDSRTAGKPVAANNGTLVIPVAGMKGIPLMGSGISAVAVNVTTITSGSGYLRVWGNGMAEPRTSSVSYDPGRYGAVTNLVTMQLGADGALVVRNVSTTASDVVVDLQGYYASAADAIPSGQNTTQRFVDLQGNAIAGGGAFVSYQYRIGTTGAFGPVPTGDVDPAPSAWPEGQSNGAFSTHRWDLRKTLGTADELVQVQACYGANANDPSPVCAAPDNLSYTAATFSSSNSTQSLGPGTLSSNTGDFQVSATDADAATALGSLSIGRSLTTLKPGTATSGPAAIFGPGWKADLAGPSAGAADLKVTDNSDDGYLTFDDPDNGQIYYVADKAGSSRYLPDGDDSGDGVVVTKSGTTITMTQADGTATTWTRLSGTGSSATWQTQSVVEPGAAQTTYSYDSNGLVTRILAPVPTGVTCSSPDTTPGCRSLTLSYDTVSTGAGNATRLTGVALSVPQTSGNTNKITVASYDYDSAGRLAHAWDPRISPALKTTYTYDSDNRLKSLTPSGLATWSLAFDGAGRLSKISRPDPSGKTAVSTVVYDVPLDSSSGARPDLTPGRTGLWGQVGDLPVANGAVAVFGPDREPAGADVANIAASDWPYASISYLDVNGRTVDTANYGAGKWQIGATGYDGTGNEIWSLTPGNRDQALNNTSDTDSYVASKSGSASQAALLTSAVTYDPLSPGKVTDTLGPTHPIVLSSGTTIHGRSHVATSYDEGAPNNDVNPATNQPYNLPTTMVTSAYRVDGATPGDTSDADSRTVRKGYDAVGSGDKPGWDLGQVTTSTMVIPNGTDLVTSTRYDANGRVIGQRLPNDTAGNGPRSTLTTYFSAGGSGSCVDPTRAGLICSTAPGGQPSSGAPLPVTTYTYDQFGNQTTKTETVGSGNSQVVRTTSSTFDAAERPASSTVAVTPTSAGGTVLPTVKTGYATDTGLATSTSTTTNGVTTTVSTGYDTLGRKVKYTDASGTVSTTTYDVSGNVVSTNDGKKTTTYNTDSGSEHRGLVVGEDIGVSTAPSAFSASYDAAGNLTSETYPNGLVAARKYDNAGNLYGLTYTKDGSTWMTFTQDTNALGEVAHQTSPLSTQTFGYDAADRLTTVQDTYKNACTTRTYSFDNHSNRTHLKTYAPGSDNACSTGTTPTDTSYTYDDADRLTSDSAGTYAYDQLGRATTIPADDAKGSGNHSTVSGNVTLGYFANDMVARQQQATSNVSFTMDPLQNRVLTQSEGAASTTMHYADDDDSPSWSASGTSWQDFDTDMTGNLAATTTQTGDVSLSLVNPHGDVVATVADRANASGTTSYQESTEYGLARDRSATFNTYAWLGGKQRSANDLGGLTMMGSRLYSSAVGRFTSVDSVPGGNANAYVYPNDPVNGLDLDGKCFLGWCHVWHGFKWLAKRSGVFDFIFLGCIMYRQGRRGARDNRHGRIGPHWPRWGSIWRDTKACSTFPTYFSRL